MRRIFVAVSLILVSMGAQAQYKKASFLNKGGRTYDLGFTGHLISANGSMTPGFYYSYGKDKGDKRLFHWFDLELLLPSDYSYKTEDFDTKETVSVRGKTKTGLVYRYNLAGYLLDNTNESNKVLPFLTGGVNLVILGGSAKSIITDPEYANTVETPAYSTFSVGANAGVGVIYNISSKFGLKAVAGYNYQYNVDTNEYNDEDYKVFNVFTSHPYVSVGVRFRMISED